MTGKLKTRAAVLLFAALNLGLLAAVIGLGFVAFLASLEIALLLGAQVIASTNDSVMRGSYALATLRNVWLLAGGALWLGIMILCINHYFKRWRARRLQRVYLAALAVEALIIGAQFLLTA